MNCPSCGHEIPEATPEPAPPDTAALLVRGLSGLPGVAGVAVRVGAEPGVYDVRVDATDPLTPEQHAMLGAAVQSVLADGESVNVTVVVGVRDGQ